MKLHKALPELVQLIIVVLLTFYGVYERINDKFNFIDSLIQYIPLLIISFIAIWAMYKSKGLVSFLLVLITFYPNGIMEFASWLFGIFDNGINLDGYVALRLVITVFLIMMVISYLFDNPKTSKKNYNIEIGVLFGYLAYSLLYQSVPNALYLLVLPLVIYVFGSDFLGVLFMISKLITIPLILFKTLDANIELSNSAWIYYILGIVLLVFSFVALSKNISKNGYKA